MSDQQGVDADQAKEDEPPGGRDGSGRKIELGPLGVGLVLFFLGIIVGFPLAIIGSTFLTENAGIIVAVVLTVAIILGVLGAALILFRRRILSYLFSVSTAKLEEFSKPLSDTARHILERESSAAIASAEQLTRLAFARWAWIATRRWLVASLTGLLAALAALAGTALLFRQNEILTIQLTRLEQQNSLLASQIGLGEAQRSAEILTGLLDIGAQLAQETEVLLKDGRPQPVFKIEELSNGLRARIVAATHAVRPYRYLKNATVDPRDIDGINRAALARRPEILADPKAIDGIDRSAFANSLIDRPVSPERGMIVTLLFNSGIYETERLSFENADFAYADIRASVISEMSFRFARLRFSDFSRLQLNTLKFGAAELDHARFRHAVLRACDFSGIPFYQDVHPYKGDPSLPIQRTNLTGADFSDSILLDTAFASINGLAMNFDRAILSEANFDDASISGTTFRNTVLVASSFEGASLKAVDFDGAIVFEADFLSRLSREARTGTFKADRYVVEPLSQPDFDAHPRAPQFFSVPQHLIAGKSAYRIKRVGGF